MKQVVIISNIKEVYENAQVYNVCESRSGFRLGEVVYDQCGCIGMIMAFYDGGQVRLDSNGCCDDMDLRKCPIKKALNAIKKLNKEYRHLYAEHLYEPYNKQFKAEVVEDFKEEDRVYLNSKDFAQYQRNLMFYAEQKGYKKLKEYVRTSLTNLRFTFFQWRLVYSILWVSKEGYLFRKAA